MRLLFVKDVLNKTDKTVIMIVKVGSGIFNTFLRFRKDF